MSTRRVRVNVLESQTSTLRPRELVVLKDKGRSKESYQAEILTKHEGLQADDIDWIFIYPVSVGDLK